MEPKYLTVVVSAFVSEKPNLATDDSDANEYGEGGARAVLPFNAAAGMNVNFMFNLAAEEAVKDAINKGLLSKPGETPAVPGPSEPVIYPTKSE